MITEGNIREIYDITGLTPLAGGYEFTFPYTSAQDVRVYTTGNRTDTEVSTSNYIIDESGATPKVVFIAGYSFPAGQTKLTIIRNVSYSQKLDLRNGDLIDADKLEGALDNITQQIQQVAEKVDRAILSSVSDTEPLSIPEASQRNNMLLGFDSEGKAIPVLTTDIEQKLAQALAAEESAITAKNAAENAQHEAESAQSAAETAQGKAETAQAAAESAEASSQTLLASIETKTEESIASINTTKTGAVGAVTTQQATSVAAVQAAQNTAESDIAGKRSSALTAIDTAKTTAVAAVNTQKETSVAAADREIVAKRDSALTDIQTARTNAVNAITTKKDQSLQEVEQLASERKAEINSLAANQKADVKQYTDSVVASAKTEIDTEKTTAVTAVQEEGDAKVAIIGSSGDAEVIRVQSVYQTDLNELKGDLDTTKSQLSESIVEISDIVYDEVNLEVTEKDNGWFNYSTGQYYKSDATIAYKLKLKKGTKIKAFLTSETDALGAIGFYASDELNQNSYIKEYSIDFDTGIHKDGKWYSATVPDDNLTTVVVTLKSSETVPTAKILICITDKIKSLNDEMNDVLEKIVMFAPMDVFGKFWIRNSNGEKVASDATRTYVYNLREGSNIKAYLHGTTNVLSAISFFSTDEIKSDGYMKEESIAFEQATKARWYNAVVPNGAKIVAITTDVPTETFSPSIIVEVGDSYLLSKSYTDRKIADCNGEINKLISKNDYGVPFDFDKFWYHFGMNAVADRQYENIIPSQSIYDINLAHRLEFKIIELNVQPTATSGKYIVTHGLNSALGHDFDDLNGNDACGTPIGSTSYDTLVSNYVYRSPIAKYRVPPTLLEDALVECKRLNMIPLFHYRDKKSLDIAIGIMGENIIVYNCQRKDFAGMIFDWCYYDTKEEIIARCKTFGKPYIYGMDNPFKFSKSELREIIDEVHALGCKIAFAYQETINADELIALGFDCGASTYYDVPMFTSGNIVECHADNTFTDFNTNGIVSDGILNLTNGQYIKKDVSEKPFISKTKINIIFKGTLTINETEYTSNGSRTITLCRGGVNYDTDLNIVSIGNAWVIDIDYIVSRC